MSMRFGRSLLILGLAAFGIAEAASATLYVSRRYCGGGAFTTCAAIQVDVTGTTVTIRVWNLSGNTAGAYGTSSNPFTAFNGIGLYNIPPSINAVLGSMTTTGPSKPFNSAPSSWVLSNNKTIGFLIDFAATPSTTGPTGFQNTIASGCAPLGQLPSTPMFYNPCTDPNAGSLTDWVTFQFQVTQTWNASNVGIVVRGKNIMTGQSTECWTAGPPMGGAQSCFTVTPEPVTMTLLATGLLGLGGLDYLRRRRKLNA